MRMRQQGKPHGDDRTPIGVVRRGHLSAVLVEDLLNDRETESGAGGTTGKEGLKDLFVAQEELSQSGGTGRSETCGYPPTREFKLVWATRPSRML